jgi:hypothetical protein
VRLQSVWNISFQAFAAEQDHFTALVFVDFPLPQRAENRYSKDQGTPRRFCLHLAL